MFTVALIGLGRISRYYKTGLDASAALKLVAVCDVSRTAPSLPDYKDYPFYTDYRTMLQEQNPDYVVLSTPPQTHFTIAKDCLQMGIGVITEKPATLSLEELEGLMALSEQLHVPYISMFHWQYSSEILEFNRRFDPRKIQTIRVCIQDAYSDDGITIREERRGLLGVWMDSGINALSFLRLWLPFESVIFKHSDTVLCPQSGLPIFVDNLFSIDGISVRICVDWRGNTDEKFTTLTYDGQPLILHHSRQKILFGGEEIFCDQMERLSQHYYEFFRQFPPAIAGDAVLQIYKTLFFKEDDQ